MTEQLPFAIDGQTHPAIVFRRALGMVTTEGVAAFNSSTPASSDDLKVIPNTGLDLKVIVKRGGAWVQGDSALDQGLYAIYNDANIVLDVPSPDSTNARKDIVVAQVNDEAYGALSSGWTATYIAGTPAGSPVAPAVPDSALLLATINVAANASAITGTNITDNRQLANKSGVAIAAKVYRSSNFSVPNAALTAITWNAEAYDSFGFHASNSTLLKVPSGQDGLYVVDASVQFENNGTGVRRLEVYVNGVVMSKEIIDAVDASFNTFMPTLHFEGQLDVGDEVEVRAYQNSGGSLSLDLGVGLTWATIRRVGAT